MSPVDTRVSFGREQPLGRLLLGLCFSFLDDDVGGNAGSHLAISPCECALDETWKPESSDSDINLSEMHARTQLAHTGEAILIVKV